MKFGVRRLNSNLQYSRRYHLFDEDGRLELVADHGSPWLLADPDRTVRFARANGDAVASMALPRQRPESGNGQHSVSYAIILNHAVYAIVNEHQDSTKTDSVLSTYFTIEVEGMRWLALKQPARDAYVCLYDEVPADLTIYEEPLEAPLPEPVGEIHQSTGEYDLTAEISAGRLTQTALVLLALIFLVDRPANTE